MKSTMITGLAAILLLAISCTKENITRTSSAATQSTVKALTFTIGQHYGGGIIFYIDTTGQHGLIADTADLQPSGWMNTVYTVTGATATRIDSGKSNTIKIVLSQGDSGIQYAARRCWHYTGSGYTDWFLPSRNELNRLYKHKSVVGGFADYVYWSSSEYDKGFAWLKNFSNGAQAYDYKERVLNVRAVRAF